MNLELTPFDAADYITSDQDVRWFLEAALTDGETHDFIRALRTVARARTADVIAASSGLSLEQFNAILANDLNPDLAGITKILHGLGLRFAVEPIVPQTDAA